MIFNLKMFEPEKDYAVVTSMGYESVLRHSHEFVEMVYVVSGTAVQKLNYESITVRAGDMFVIADSQIVHFMRPICEESEFKVINIIFKPDLVDFDYSVFKPVTPVSILDYPEIMDVIDLAMTEYEEREPYCDDIVKGCIQFLLGSLARMHGSDGVKAKNNRNANYVMKAVKYISENFASKLTLSDVAASVGLSPGYLQKIFRRERETSIIEYLLRYRVEQSCKLLIETDKTVAEVCESIGFSDIKNFHYAFKKVMGMTPNEYRQTHRVSHN